MTGRTLGETLRELVVKDTSIIRPLSDPFSANGGLAVLKGNLAPDGILSWYSRNVTSGDRGAILR